jgi:predicted kinase
MSNEYTPVMLVLIRSVPGGGKSTLARNKYVTQGFAHFEADMYFMRGGEYQFNPSLLGQAHFWCQKMTEDNLKAGRSVVVSNTFTTHREIAPYVKMAKDMGIEVKIIHAQGNFKNVHNVPEEALTRMRNRWQPYPGEEIYIPQ